MRLVDKINLAIKEAMKAKESERLSVMRLIKTDLNKAELDTGKDLDAEGELKVLRRMAKQRRESIEQFRAGGRGDLLAKEEAELRVIQEFLPDEIGSEEIERVVDSVLSEIGPIAPGTTTGMIMGKIMGRLKGTGKVFDGRQVNELVLKKLKP